MPRWHRRARPRALLLTHSLGCWLCFKPRPGVRHTALLCLLAEMRGHRVGNAAPRRGILQGPSFCTGPWGLLRGLFVSKLFLTTQLRPLTQAGKASGKGAPCPSRHPSGALLALRSVPSAARRPQEYSLRLDCGDALSGPGAGSPKERGPLLAEGYTPTLLQGRGRALQGVRVFSSCPVQATDVGTFCGPFTRLPGSNSQRSFGCECFLSDENKPRRYLPVS